MLFKIDRSVLAIRVNDPVKVLAVGDTNFGTFESPSKDLTVANSHATIFEILWSLRTGVERWIAQQIQFTLDHVKALILASIVRHLNFDFAERFADRF